MLELQYILFTNFNDINKFEGLVMDTDSLYFALAEKKLENSMRPEVKTKWKQLWSKKCSESCTADARRTFSSRRCYDKH